jgi:hypothetical protein
MIDRHLQAVIFRQRGQNGPLVVELLEKLSPESKERLFRVLQGMEQEVQGVKSRARRYGLR